MLNAITVDLEEWFHVCKAERFVPRERWGALEERVGPATHKLLDLFDAHRMKATFHVLGYVAERHPDLVREIDRRGHDVGVHSYWHRRVDELTPDEFERDLVQARDIVSAIVGHPVRGYRAPEWSITHRTPWAFAILRRHGFEIDSSIMPAFWTRRNGWGNTPFKVATPSGDLWEFPGTTVSYLGQPVPVAEGTVMRLVPVQMLLQKIRGLNRRSIPINLSLHPWELDPGFPRIRFPLFRGFTHYMNLRAMEGRLRRLLDAFPFGTAPQALAQIVRNGHG